MPELRFRFEKLGKAAYLSHLDLMRTFQRSFHRAEVGLRHSEGFNPHPKMSIGLPLQLGCESLCEALDADVLTGPADLAAALNAALPEGIRVTAVYPPEMAANKVKYVEWALYFPNEAKALKAAECLGAASLVVEKKTKRGVAPLDLAPHLKVLGREGETLRLLLSASEPTVNTGDVAKALPAELAPQGSRRLRLYAQNMVEFM